MGLADPFRARRWNKPHTTAVAAKATGNERLDLLDIPRTGVELIFFNRREVVTDCALSHPGDRVALEPPACREPPRFLPGFKAYSVSPAFAGSMTRGSNFARMAHTKTR